MDINDFLDSIPPVSDREFIVSLLEVMGYHCFSGAYRDSIVATRPDQMFQNVLALMGWVRAQGRDADSDAPEPAE